MTRYRIGKFLQETRTRAMNRKLRDVESIDSKEAKDILELPTDIATD